MKEPGADVEISNVHGHVSGNIIAGRDVYVAPRNGTKAGRARYELIEQVRNAWITGYLHRQVLQKVFMEIGIAIRDDLVLTRKVYVAQQDALGLLAEHGRLATTHLAEIYTRSGRSMLVVGEPGSGKTTTLLSLADQLLSRAAVSAQERIPVVLNLSTWRGGPFESWIIEEINCRYSVPIRRIKAWLKDGDLALMMDGLDEVALDRQDRCVNAINAFVKANDVTTVVCCRTRDYEALVSRLVVQAAVVLQPLNPNQIASYIEQFGDRLFALRRSINTDPAIAELARTPLMLNLMILAYQGAAERQIPERQSLNESRTKVFDAFVERMFEHRRKPGSPEYERADTIRYLTWLATQMLRTSTTVFTPDRLTTAYLSGTSEPRAYLFFAILSVYLVGGATFGLLTAYSHVLGTLPLSSEFSLGAAGLAAAFYAYSIGMGLWLLPTVTITVPLALLFVPLVFALIPMGSSSATSEASSQLIVLVSVTPASLFAAIIVAMRYPGEAVEPRDTAPKGIVWSIKALRWKIRNTLVRLRTGALTARFAIAAKLTLIFFLIVGMPFTVSHSVLSDHFFRLHSDAAPRPNAALELPSGVADSNTAEQRQAREQARSARESGIWQVVDREDGLRILALSSWEAIMALFVALFSLGIIRAESPGPDIGPTGFWEMVLSQITVFFGMACLVAGLSVPILVIADEPYTLLVRTVTLLPLAAFVWFFFTSLSAVAVHGLTRSVLTAFGRLPPNPRRFLNFAAERVLLARGGQSYLFVHRSLIEYFAHSPADCERTAFRRAVARSVLAGVAAGLMRFRHEYANARRIGGAPLA